MLRVELLDVLHSESEKVSELRKNLIRLGQRSPGDTHFRCSVDLGLPRVLALAEHSGRHELVAVLAANEVGRLEEYRRAVVPRERLPFPSGCERAVDSCCDGRLVGLVELCQVLGMVSGQQLFGELARFYLFDMAVERRACEVEGARTGLPLTMHGTSNGMAASISFNAASRA